MSPIASYVPRHNIGMELVFFFTCPTATDTGQDIARIGTAGACTCTKLLDCIQSQRCGFDNEKCILSLTLDRQLAYERLFTIINCACPT